MVRNAAIAAGNSGDRELIAPLRFLVDDADEAVADAARWALSELQSEYDYITLDYSEFL